MYDTMDRFLCRAGPRSTTIFTGRASPRPTERPRGEARRRWPSGLGAAERRISGAGAAQAAPSLKRWRGGDKEGVSEMERRKQGREPLDLPARALLAAHRRGRVREGGRQGRGGGATPASRQGWGARSMVEKTQRGQIWWWRDRGRRQREAGDGSGRRRGAKDAERGRRHPRLLVPCPLSLASPDAREGAGASAAPALGFGVRERESRRGCEGRGGGDRLRHRL